VRLISAPEGARVSVSDGSQDGVVIESCPATGDAVLLGRKGCGIKLVSRKDSGSNLELSGGDGAVSVSSLKTGSGIAVTAQGLPRVLLGVAADGSTVKKVLKGDGSEVK